MYMILIEHYIDYDVHNYYTIISHLVLIHIIIYNYLTLKFIHHNVVKSLSTLLLNHVGEGPVPTALIY